MKKKKKRKKETSEFYAFSIKTDFGRMSERSKLRFENSFNNAYFILKSPFKEQSHRDALSDLNLIPKHDMVIFFFRNLMEN